MWNNPAVEVGNPASLNKVFFFTDFLFGIYAVTSRWVWSSYPWAIKIDSFLVESMKLHILGFRSMAFSNFMEKICSDYDFTLKCKLTCINT